MAKQHKDELLVDGAVSSEKEAFEIIEIASDELELLARAFNLIAEVCAEGVDASDADDDASDTFVH